MERIRLSDDTPPPPPPRTAVDSALATAALPTTDALRSAFERAYRRLGRPGPTLTGAQRIGLVQIMRRGIGKEVDPLDLATADLTENDARLVRWMAQDAAGLNQEFIDQLVDTGSDSNRLLELGGIVATWSAIDHYMEGVGGRRVTLPAAEPGTPTGIINENASVSGAWLPTLGAASALTALAALPSELDAVMDLHGHFYLTGAQVMEPGHDRELSRSQMEYMAARTSYMNECFY